MDEQTEEARRIETGPEPEPAQAQTPQAEPEIQPARAEPPQAAEAPKRPKKDHTERGPALLLAAIAVVLGGTAILMAARWQPPVVTVWSPGMDLPVLQSAQPTNAPELRRAPIGDGTQLTLSEPQGEALSLQDIYVKVNPSIVTITAHLVAGMGEGTGVAMTADGYIITNSHVIEGSTQVDVSLEDGRVFEAKLVGRDTSTDLAVLKIDAGDLIPAEFGDSEKMHVGDTVAAIGNPMGSQLRGTLTSGILSAINRDMTVDGNEMTLLQTTAALNTGNSGGALINDRGQVIGITNMKLIGYTAPAEGLGFAIPTSTVKPVVDSLIEAGHVTGRPALGITVRAMTPEEKESRGLEHGLLIAEISNGSDAKSQGLKAGDVLVSANGTFLDVTTDLLAIRETLSVGDTISFDVYREGKRLEVVVALVEQYMLNGD